MFDAPDVGATSDAGGGMGILGALSTAEAVLLAIALLPALGRLLGDWLVGVLMSSARGGLRRSRERSESCRVLRAELLESSVQLEGPSQGEEEANQGEPQGPLTWEEASEKIPDWEKTRARNGQSQCHAIALASLRLLCWHLLQPVVSAVVYVYYWGCLGHMQHALGAMVLLREAMYFVMMVRCALNKPAVLLVDVAASAGDRNYLFLFSYVLSPQRVVLSVLFPTEDWACWLFSDICSCVALYVGYRAGTLPLCLAAGYALTATFVAGWLVSWLCIMISMLVSLGVVAAIVSFVRIEG